MKTLIVEDDFASRKLLDKILSAYGECDIAVDGEEAVAAFSNAYDNNDPYDLVCLDIMLPVMDGQEVLKKIREFESVKGIGGFDGVKILMTTALGDSKNIMEAFRRGCEAYLVKPILRDKIVDELVKLDLIKK